MSRSLVLCAVNLRVTAKYEELIAYILSSAQVYTLVRDDISIYHHVRSQLSSLQATLLAFAEPAGALQVRRYLYSPRNLLQYRT
jgi:hypothetical protein